MCTQDRLKRCGR